MRTITLDGARWRSQADFYNALLDVIGDPGWHGRNLDALEETLRIGHVHTINPPFAIHISGAAVMAEEVRAYLDRFLALATDLRADGIVVDVTLES